MTISMSAQAIAKKIKIGTIILHILSFNFKGTIFYDAFLVQKIFAKCIELIIMDFYVFHKRWWRFCDNATTCRIIIGNEQDFTSKNEAALLVVGSIGGCNSDSCSCGLEAGMDL